MDEIAHAPLRPRVASSSLFLVLGVGTCGSAVLVASELGFPWALTLVVAGIGFVAAAARSLWLGVWLEVDGVVVRSMFWTRRATWSEVESFVSVRLRSGVGVVESPFLQLRGDVAELVALPLIRPLLFPFESTDRRWAEVIEQFERFRCSIVSGASSQDG
ncbi:MAG: hypothetical protein ACOYOQ_14175 [Microthrixaceae bacterium]